MTAIARRDMVGAACPFIDIGESQMTRLRSFVIGALCIVAFAASGSAFGADKVRAAIDAE